MVTSFVGSPLLHVEVRHLGGALAVESADHGVLDAIDQPFVLFTFGLALDAEMLAAVQDHAQRVLAAIGAVGQRPAVPELRRDEGRSADIYPAASFDRLIQAKARYDPTNMFRANHPLQRDSMAAARPRQVNPAIAPRP